VYTIDREKRTVTDVSPGTTAEQLLANLDNDAANFTLYNWDGSVYAGGEVATGMVLKLTVDGIVTDALRIAVLGDVNCDGAADINDILCIRADIAGTGAFRACQAYAADVSRDGVVDINDILCIHAHILGTCEIHT
jgi:hypothetical protein